MMTDPIADMLTRLRNALLAGHQQVEVPASRVKIRIAKILQSEGFIKGFHVANDGKHGVIRIRLAYGPNKERVISGLQRVSKPGRRIYVTKDRIPWVRGGLGIAILSTSRGIITDKEARRLGVGGEVLCYIW
jgi:small subunit ribosomal protein S8